MESEARCSFVSVFFRGCIRLVCKGILTAQCCVDVSVSCLLYVYDFIAFHERQMSMSQFVLIGLCKKI